MSFIGKCYIKFDILIPAKYGVYQIVGDTCGPAGMMMALRTIPVYLDICREMERRCPEVIFLNHSNPMAVLCRALVKHSGIKHVIGICHGVQHGIVQLAKLLEVDPHELEVRWIGTNHYYWLTGIRLAGGDVYPEVMRRTAEYEPPPGGAMCKKLSQIYGYRILYFDDAHVIEFYPFLAQPPDVDSIPYGLAGHHHSLFRERSAEAAPTRPGQLRAFVEELDAVTLPDGPSDPLTGEGLGLLIEAIAAGRHQVHIVNIPNCGCVPNLPDYAVLELEGVTDSCGLRGVCAGEAPLVLAGILQKRIAWQELVADAAVKGERNLALQALLLDEMAIPPEKAEAMLDELLAASKDHLPQFA